MRNTDGLTYWLERVDLDVVDVQWPNDFTRRYATRVWARDMIDGFLEDWLWSMHRLQVDTKVLKWFFTDRVAKQ